MLELAINLILMVLFFALAIWAMLYVCNRFRLPDPILWIAGALLLILVLMALASLFGIAGTPQWRLFKI